jgi:hypothetical protein
MSEQYVTFAPVSNVYILVSLLPSSFSLHGSAQDRKVADWVSKIGVSAAPYIPLDTAMIIFFLLNLHGCYLKRTLVAPLKIAKVELFQILCNI